MDIEKRQNLVEEEVECNHIIIVENVLQQMFLKRKYSTKTDTCE